MAKPEAKKQNKTVFRPARKKSNKSVQEQVSKQEMPMVKKSGVVKTKKQPEAQKNELVKSPSVKHSVKTPKPSAVASVKASIKTPAKTKESLLKRVVASVVMLPIVIGALWAGYPFIDILILIVGALLAWEWSNMVPNRTAAVYTAAYIVSLAISLLVYNMPIVVSSIFLISLYVWLKARRESHRYLLTLGVPYISIGVGALLWLYRDVFIYHPYSFYMTLWFFIMVWAMDIGGYFVGTTFKGPKLAPKISPNKTWSGLIGGIVLAILASMLYFYLLSFPGVIGVNAGAQIFFAVLGGIIAVISQIGDLIESAIKRHLGLKDSSNLIPGHGGVFDRVDGLVFAAPFVYWLFAYGLWLF